MVIKVDRTPPSNVDALHYYSRSEQRKNQTIKEPSGKTWILIFQTVLFLAFLIGGILCFCQLSVKGGVGILFLGCFLLFGAAGTLFWLVPNYNVWKRNRKNG